ncbi:hypothetical protein LCL95_04575 [Bacillus timonensis]|nr:hypothetical protein [Bacillus timonensis]
MKRFFFLLTKKRRIDYDMTIFQTPAFGDEKGYREVYRLTVTATNHKSAIDLVYRKFNVSDLIPSDYTARYISTGDILFIDEGRNGQTYYKLQPGGWKKINRMFVR